MFISIDWNYKVRTETLENSIDYLGIYIVYGQLE